MDSNFADTMEAVLMYIGAWKVLVEWTPQVINWLLAKLEEAFNG